VREMKFAIDFKSLEWWFWFVTLIAMITGLSGVIEGFYVVIFVSVVQFIYFSGLKGFTAFPTQVRLVYGIFTIIALFDPTRIFYWALLVGTIMVTLFNKCIIARVLIMMPWNKDEKLVPH
jgi:hypothetical protein